MDQPDIGLQDPYLVFYILYNIFSLFSYNISVLTAMVSNVIMLLYKVIMITQ